MACERIRAWISWDTGGGTQHESREDVHLEVMNAERVGVCTLTVEAFLQGARSIKVSRLACDQHNKVLLARMQRLARGIPDSVVAAPASRAGSCGFEPVPVFLRPIVGGVMSDAKWRKQRIEPTRSSSFLRRG